jgi:hypothetical protein
MVHVSKSVDITTESQLPQGHESEFNSDDDMSLQPPSLDAIPPWVDYFNLSPLDSPTRNLDKGINNAIP